MIKLFRFPTLCSVFIFFNFVVLGSVKANQKVNANLLNSSTSLHAQSEDGAYLDPKYPIQIHPLPFILKDAQKASLPERSDTEALIAMQSEVKSQASRGTCSIFSATALLESMLIIEHGLPQSTDLSEEWLEYITHTSSSEDGSSSWSNFTAFSRYGAATEASWPYIGQEWKSIEDSSLARERCDKLKSLALKSCLIGHRNPTFLQLDEISLNAADTEFANIRHEAFEMRDQELSSLKNQPVKRIFTQQNVKSLLFRHTPVTLDLDFYYAAWNHREAQDYGIKRNLDHWNLGIIGFPEEGSKDIEVSLANPAGHSIVVVGYDDTIVVENDVQLQDGSVKSFKHKGVYYFKNSWGTSSFGSQFKLNQIPYPGYGMITQDYAHQYGTFFQLPLKK